MRFEGKFNRPKKFHPKKFTREALLAALAAFSTPSADAGLAEEKHRSVRNSAWPASVRPEEKRASTKPQLKEAPKPAERPKSLEAARKAEQARRYEILLQRLSGDRLVPKGEHFKYPDFEKFCKDLALVCKQFADQIEGRAYSSDFTIEHFATIESINRAVNANVKPVEDIEQYKIAEHWTIPGDSGDCEDYVLLKMTRLISAGIAPSDLHIVIAKDDKNEGHAVLGVDVFAKGTWHTLILDNKFDDIITVKEMDSRYLGVYMSAITASKSEGYEVKFYYYRMAR